MSAQVIGISGSPIKKSNTDRMVQHILDSTGLKTEFIKLSKRKVQPCIACMGCTHDNICKVKDDFQEIAEKVKTAGAIVVGGYPPYGAIDAFTKAFLERLFSFRHQNNLNEGKLAVTVVTGIGRGLPGLDEASQQINYALTLESMDVLGDIKVTGNVDCLVCDYNATCKISSLPHIFGEGAMPSPDKFCTAEDQRVIWLEAQRLGQEIGKRLSQ